MHDTAAIDTTSSGTRTDRAAPARRPGERDPLLDLVRTAALGVVVVWHWVFTSVRWASDGPHVGNPVAATPGLWVLTWVLQVMPAFFVVGGALHARDRAPAQEFWRRRARRLVVPVLPLLGLAGAAALVAHLAGREDLVRAVLLVVSPMWFLATYLVCIAVTPLARRWHDRYGIGVVAVGLVAAGAVDAARIGGGIGGAVTGVLAFCIVWSTVHQLGFSFERLRAASRRTQIAVTCGGYGALALLAWLGPHPTAMVGLDGHRLSNMGPPTVMVVLLAIGQLGLLAWSAPLLTRWATHRRRALRTAGAWSMTVYAWHLGAYVAFWALAAALGLEVTAGLAAGWWAQRPLWLVGPLVLAVPLCRAVRRLDPTGVPQVAAVSSDPTSTPER
ncbi:MAG: acyltransferase family protein [Microthrixaceae bacterium]